MMKKEMAALVKYHRALSERIFQALVEAVEQNSFKEPLLINNTVLRIPNGDYLHNISVRDRSVALLTISFRTWFETHDSKIELDWNMAPIKHFEISDTGVNNVINEAVALIKTP